MEQGKREQGGTCVRQVRFTECRAAVRSGGKRPSHVQATEHSLSAGIRVSFVAGTRSLAYSPPGIQGRVYQASVSNVAGYLRFACASTPCAGRPRLRGSRSTPGCWQEVLTPQQPPDLPHQRQSHSTTDLILPPSPEVALLPSRRPLNNAVQQLGCFRALATPGPKRHRGE